MVSVRQREVEDKLNINKTKQTHKNKTKQERRQSTGVVVQSL